MLMTMPEIRNWRFMEPSPEVDGGIIGGEGRR
jgi:hypothetical protein